MEKLNFNQERDIHVLLPKIFLSITGPESGCDEHLMKSKASTVDNTCVVGILD